MDDFGEQKGREEAERSLGSLRSPQLDVEAVAAMVVDTALQLHRDLGPGLLESVYEALLARMLAQRGLKVERQRSVPICYRGMELDEGFRLDLLVDDQLVIELKSTEQIHPVHSKQVLTYLRLMGLPLGLLINFGAPLLKEGIKRIVNHHSNFSSSRLRLHRSDEQIEASNQPITPDEIKPL